MKINTTPWGEGGGGLGPKGLCQTWPDNIFPMVNFVFPHCGHFGLGGSSPGGGGGGAPCFGKKNKHGRGLGVCTLHTGSSQWVPPSSLSGGPLFLPFPAFVPAFARVQPVLRPKESNSEVLAYRTLGHTSTLGHDGAGSPTRMDDDHDAEVHTAGVGGCGGLTDFLQHHWPELDAK